LIVYLIGDAFSNLISNLGDDVASNIDLNPDEEVTAKVPLSTEKTSPMTHDDLDTIISKLATELNSQGDFKFPVFTDSGTRLRSTKHS